LSDGCERSITSDINNCGGCDLKCSLNHISATCSSGGACNGTCDTGYADCDSNKQTNGCETDLNTTAANCGACGRVCSSNHVTGSGCSAGSCTGTCSSGFADCNSNFQLDGCEVAI